MTQSKHSATKHYQQLTPEERGEIEAYLNAGKSQADIARLTNRSRSTISREIKRGTIRQRNSDYLFFTKYFADTSQLIHDKARQNCRFGGLEKVAGCSLRCLKQRLNGDHGLIVLMVSCTPLSRLILTSRALQRRPFIGILIKAA